MSGFQQAKLWLMQWLGLPREAIHIYVGLAIFLLSAALFRWRLRSWKPLGAVAAAAVLGEAWDIIDSLRFGILPVWERSWHDVWVVCFWPSLLFLVARYTRLFDR